MKKTIISCLTIALGIFAGSELISFKNNPTTYLLSDAQIAQKAAIADCKVKMAETVDQINRNAEFNNQRIAALGGEFDEGLPKMSNEELEERCKNVKY